MSLLLMWTADCNVAAAAGHLTPDEFAGEFTRCSRTLWCIAAGVLGNRSNADDVLQEGAIIALGKLDQFDRTTSFIAWMGKIVRYVALNHARRRQRSPLASVDPEALAAVGASPKPAASPPATGRGEIIPDQDDFDDEVLGALNELDPIARSCLLLRTLMELPYREISLAMDVPEGTAMSHVHRARRSLRERLRDRDAGSQPALENA